MNILDKLLTDTIINALGWSIFHILWQGFIVAILAGLVLRILKYKSANLRYIISVFSLLLIVGLSVFNFVNNYNSNSDISFNKINELGKTEPTNSQYIDFKDVSLNNLNVDILETVNNRISTLSKYFPITVHVWIFGVLILLIKFVLSFIYSKRLKNIEIKPVTSNLISRFDKIRLFLKINKSVQYIESILVEVPVVLGYFKPVILIPTEIITGMPSNQLDAIIAHELAHIRRNDYIINVLQTIIETILFFHPAVWLISNKIRDERENCCDDMALNVNNDSFNYAKALVSIQELTLKKHYAAVAFSGRKKHLLNRIKRMIMKPKVKSNLMDKIIATCIILSAILGLSFTYSATTNEEGFENEIFNNKVKTVVKAPERVIKAEAPAKIEKLVSKDSSKIRNNDVVFNTLDIEDNTITKFYEKNGHKKEMKFTLQNGKVTELYINGKEIPEKDYEKYQDEIDETIEDLKEAKEDIKDAMHELNNIDMEEMHKEIEKAMQEVHIDMKAVQEEIARAMEEVKIVEIEDVLKDLDIELNELNNLDFDFDFHIDGEKFHFDLDDINMEEIRAEMEKTRKILREQVDIEEIQNEMRELHKELSKIDKEEIKLQMKENLKHFDNVEKEEKIKDLEKKLQELEQLELEEK